jgi:spore coat protein U-like protein
MMRRISIALSMAAGAAAALCFASAASAATATGTINESITITASCTVGTSTTVAFGSQGLLNSPVNNTGALSVQCSNTTPYNVGLDPGGASGATVTTRAMSGGGATVSYALYRDSGRTLNWGETVGTDTLAGTGNGAAQSITVYAQVPAQTTPAPGAYTDTVNVTVTY